MVSISTFRQLSLSYEGATEQPHFDKTSFRVNKKIFATPDVKISRACIMLSESGQSVFSAYDTSIIYPVPNKWGKHGATYVELKMVPKIMLRDVPEQAYNKSALKSRGKKEL